MAWIESHEDLENHPKLIALGLAMGWNRYETSGRLHVFWKWCLKYAPTGDLHKYNDAQLADAVGLNPSDAHSFIKAMTADESCWIDRGHGPKGESIFRVHDWPDYVKRYLKDAKFRDRPEKWQEVLAVYAVSMRRNKLSSDSRVTRELHTVPTNQPTNPIPISARARDKPDSDAPDPLRIKALEAFESWCSMKSPVGLERAIRTFNNEHIPITTMLDALVDEPLVAQGGVKVSQPALVPQVVDYLRNAGRPFKHVAYAVKSVRSELERWALDGAPSHNGNHLVSKGNPRLKGPAVRVNKG